MNLCVLIYSVEEGEPADHYICELTGIIFYISSLIDFSETSI